MATEPKWKLQCKYPSLQFLMPLPSNSISVETTAKKKNGSQNQNQVALVSGVPQKSNTIRFRLPRQISQKIAGRWKYACQLVMLKSWPIHTAHWCVQHCCICLPDSCLFSVNKKPHKAAENSCGLMCLDCGYSEPVHPVGKNHAA